MYLLDTHTLIWFIEGDESLPNNLRSIISKPENEIFISIASLWEIAIKKSIGKLPISKNIEQICEGLEDDNFQTLAINNSHIKLIETLPLHHRDPFDRMLIAQSIVEGLDIISIDEAFDNYDVNRIW